MHIFQFNHQRLRPWLLAVLAFLLGFNLSLSQAAEQPLNPANQTVSIFVEQSSTMRPWLVMGDSLSAAYGIDVNQGWVALLAKRLDDIPVVNASISGETTSGGKQRLKPLMQEHRPSVLVLELGANDALRGQDLNTTKHNLQFMIDQCQQQQPKCQVVLLGIRLPTNYGPAYDQFLQLIYRQLAEQNKLLFDPFFIEDAATDPDLMQDDTLHPNAQAQPKIAERIYELITPLLPKTE